ncbi:DUF3761 domain-containing protein [Luteibacter sp. 22Crub2.1]|uniref:DUF3761 domain-containing protein n=1 Tax=Luteibacter sp. 22Crub2.1 TaxID=1283288 RepID=UPI0009A7E266
MIRQISFSLLALLLLAPHLANSEAATQPREPKTGTPVPATLVEDGYYTSRSGVQVHRPAHTTDNHAPAGASAQCRDGTFSFSVNRRGTCSRHGGVASWL